LSPVGLSESGMSERVLAVQVQCMSEQLDRTLDALGVLVVLQIAPPLNVEVGSGRHSWITLIQEFLGALRERRLEEFCDFHDDVVLQAGQVTDFSIDRPRVQL